MIVNVTTDELKLVEMHIRHFSIISKERIKDVWRDEHGYLCVKYQTENSGEIWFHYNAELKEWW